ncbi:vWA domain-containing protein [Actinophytocola sp.]|uniref:vWA domain-containing protein n=1 Tax=Actinophytocola sp. TaxID=1872138 RepID=UPI00389A4739
MPEQILPFYVVCDQSYSMTDHLDALNDGLAQLHAAVGTDPVVADKTRFCLIGFSGEAEVLQPLCRASDVVGLTDLTTQAATSFGEAFTLLRHTIENDVDELKSRGDQVYRPAVFFLSDGHPTDHQTWPAAYERLVDPNWPPRPNIIAFGIGDADATTIGRIGTVQAFMSQGGVTPADALHCFARALTTSVVRSQDDGEVALRVPARIDGFTTLRIDPL